MTRKKEPRRQTSATVAVNLERVPLAALKPDAKNARRHPDRNRAAVRDSFTRFGAARSVVMDGEGEIVAGNASLEGAKAAGVKSALIVDADGTELIVVRRKDLKGKKSRAYALADNRTGELADWDEDRLAETLRELDADVAGATGFDAAEISRLLGAAEDKPPAESAGGAAAGAFQILLACESESAQRDLLAEFQKRGLICRALLS